MKPLDVIELLQKMADNLERWAERTKTLSRRMTPKLLPPVNFERSMEWLERNKPNMVAPIRRNHDQLMSCAKGIDQLITKGTKSDFETATSRLCDLKYYAIKLANTLRDTTQELEHELAIEELAESGREKFGFHPRRPSE